MRETEPLIGMFVNSVVLRSQLTGEIDFRELLKQTSQTISEAAMHQDLPFEKLVEELQPPRDPGYNPYFQIVFSFTIHNPCAGSRTKGKPSTARISRRNST
jgi:non-ribosomal peptide synthetase component F